MPFCGQILELQEHHQDLCVFLFRILIRHLVIGIRKDKHQCVIVPQKFLQLIAVIDIRNQNLQMDVLKTESLQLLKMIGLILRDRNGDKGALRHVVVLFSQDQWNIPAVSEDQNIICQRIFRHLFRKNRILIHRSRLFDGSTHTVILCKKDQFVSSLHEHLRIRIDQDPSIRFSHTGHDGNREIAVQLKHGFPHNFRMFLDIKLTPVIIKEFRIYGRKTCMSAGMCNDTAHSIPET